MLCLEKSKSDIFNHFLSGRGLLFAELIALSGISTDLVIEQVVMRFLKTTGGRVMFFGGFLLPQKNLELTSGGHLEFW